MTGPEQTNTPREVQGDKEPVATAGQPVLPAVSRKGERLAQRLTAEKLAEFIETIDKLDQAGKPARADGMIRGFTNRVLHYVQNLPELGSLSPKQWCVCTAYAEVFIERGRDDLGRQLIKGAVGPEDCPNIPFRSFDNFADTLSALQRRSPDNAALVRVTEESCLRRSRAIMNEPGIASKDSLITDSTLAQHLTLFRKLNTNLPAANLSEANAIIFSVLRARGISEILSAPVQVTGHAESTGPSKITEIPNAYYKKMWPSHFTASGDSGFRVSCNTNAALPQEILVSRVRSAEIVCRCDYESNSLNAILPLVNQDGTVALVHNALKCTLIDVRGEPRAVTPISGPNSHFIQVAVPREGNIALALEYSRPDATIDSQLKEGDELASPSRTAKGRWWVTNLSSGKAFPIEVSDSSDPYFEVSPSGNLGYVLIPGFRDRNLGRLYSALNGEEIELPAGFNPSAAAGNDGRVVFSPGEKFAFVLGFDEKGCIAAYDVVSKRYVRSEIRDLIAGLQLDTSGRGYGIANGNLVRFTPEGIELLPLRSFELNSDVIRMSKDGAVAFAILVNPKDRKALRSFYDLNRGEFVQIEGGWAQNATKLFVSPDGSSAFGINTTSFIKTAGGRSNVVDLKARSVAQHGPEYASDIISSASGKKAIIFSSDEIVDLVSGKRHLLAGLLPQQDRNAILQAEDSVLRAVVIDRSAPTRFFELEVAL